MVTTFSNFHSIVMQLFAVIVSDQFLDQELAAQASINLEIYLCMNLLQSHRGSTGIQS